jgi:hypothetical protein
MTDQDREREIREMADCGASSIDTGRVRFLLGLLDQARQERDEARDQLRSMVEDFFVLGLEYARVKTMGVRLADGALLHVGSGERTDIELYLLNKLATRAVSNLAHMTAYPGEAAAMTPQERSRQRETRQRRGETDER